MKEQLLGTTLPVLSISLDAGESVVAETGEFSWMTDSIQMSTGMGGGAGGHGVMGALKRAAGGSSLFLSTYTATDSPGTIAFASKLPGSILGVDIGSGAEYLVHRQDIRRRGLRPPARRRSGPGLDRAGWRGGHLQPGTW
jgi:uncharacterized protein (AIM24 family)